MAVAEMTFTEYLMGLKSPELISYLGGLERAVNAGEISTGEFSRIIEEFTGNTVKVHRNQLGDVIGYTLERPTTVTTPNPINSNASTVSRGIVSKPLSSGVSQAGKSTISTLRGVGTKVLTGAATVGTAAACVSTGITLGKAFDGALYSFNPDFWDSIGMSSLNPETWRAITYGDDSFGASVINFLFGFDDAGETEAYLEQEAFAYMSAYMYSMGVFAGSEEYIYEGDLPSGKVYDYPTLAEYPVSTYKYLYTRNNWFYKWGIVSGSAHLFPILNGTYYRIVAVSDTPFTYSYVSWARGSTEPEFTTIYNSNEASFILNNVEYTYYYAGRTIEIRTADWSESVNPAPYAANPSPYSDMDNNDIFTIYYLGETGGIPGISNQSGATLPNTSGWDDYSNVLPSLQQQYPQLWDNAIQYPVMQDDGSIKTYTYLPVAMPYDFTRNGEQPISGESSQANPEINPSTYPSIDELTKILVNPYPITQPDTETDTEQPPTNPVDTGDGSTPVPVAPIGSASALWKIYHPTQAQIDAFGAWLWSSDFIDQILKIFNDPMQAIIGLHKIYANPVDAGTATIKVGYLDSEVPSAYTEQQYVYVDCGSIDLVEQFGNVFDYSPYTDVQLYLPFIGIVPLNVSDVMRSTISITYGVDVLTGACLAMVEVSRDLNNAVMYQYAGNCAVQYPLSSGSYMGIVASIISVAGGIAATVATGGGAAPIALGAAGAAMNAHTNVQHSGSFSGNPGAMGGKIPYLIISRPQTKVATNFEMMQGYPANEYVLIGNCSGYIQAEVSHIINVNATDDELNMINELLNSGIII